MIDDALVSVVVETTAPPRRRSALRDWSSLSSPIPGDWEPLAAWIRCAGVSACVEDGQDSAWQAVGWPQNRQLPRGLWYNAGTTASADAASDKKKGVSVVLVGWPGASQPPAPSDPGVTVSRHRALLTGPSVRADPLPVSE